MSGTYSSGQSQFCSSRWQTSFHVEGNSAMAIPLLFFQAPGSFVLISINQPLVVNGTEIFQIWVILAKKWTVDCHKSQYEPLRQAQ